MTNPKHPAAQNALSGFKLYSKVPTASCNGLKSIGKSPLSKMDYGSRLQSRARREYEKLPAVKRIPLVISYCINKSIAKVPNAIKGLVDKGCALMSGVHLLFCASVPFVYIYQRDKNVVGDSILSAE